MKEFRESSGRQLECFFLDIARQISRTLGQAGLACPCATVLKDGSASTPSSGTGGSTAFAAACVHGPAACEGDPATCGAELAAVRRDLTAIAACGCRAMPSCLQMAWESVLGSTELLNLAAGNVISTGTHCWLFPVKASNCFFS
ncbi:hypothetical protein WJX77_004443 [Trebouxia sp. C0004]